MKAVVDSSVLISAFLMPKSGPGQVLRAGLEGKFQLLVSPMILTEVDRSLRTKRGLLRFGYTEAERKAFVENLAAAAELVEDVPIIPPVCRDPDDDHVLAAALAVRADCIVTGDRDLLDLWAYQGIRILTVRQLLDSIPAR